MISKRIKTLAALIDSNERVLDVGCDHAFLAVWLKKNGHSGPIACTELREGPRQNALRNLQENGIEDVEVWPTYGVENVEFDADVVVMAGMGFTTVTKIISGRPEYFAGKRMIIQINTEVDKMRRWLMSNGFKIDDELMIRDYKYYEILTVSQGQMELNEQQIEFGPYLLQHKNEVFVECYQKRIAKLETIRESLPENHPDIRRIQEQIEKIKKVLN
ncbi:MAG: tRNA (adenine(22)-N(1))-methyltransferase TrmK [Erysipelotrichaceae bacterium]|nr:tRNA (adenine(22)-N(1))-methyltransferase TrmK [Erysipelotrichaceae bacterium]